MASPPCNELLVAWAPVRWTVNEKVCVECTDTTEYSTVPVAIWLFPCALCVPVIFVFSVHVCVDTTHDSCSFTFCVVVVVRATDTRQLRDSRHTSALCLYHLLPIVCLVALSLPGILVRVVTRPR